MWEPKFGGLGGDKEFLVGRFAHAIGKGTMILQWNVALKTKLLLLFRALTDQSKDVWVDF